MGDDRYRRQNDSYGLATLARAHVRPARGRVESDPPGKSGRRLTVRVEDRAACAVVRALVRRGGDGERLLAYGEGGAWHDLHADELNACLREHSGADLMARDFRTWHATVPAAALADGAGAGAPSAARRRAVRRTVAEAAAYLGDTPAVCRASYIAPRVLERYEEGVALPPGLRGRDRVERAVPGLLDEEDGTGRA